MSNSVHKRGHSHEPQSFSNELNFAHFGPENDGLLPVSNQDIDEKYPRSGSRTSPFTPKPNTGSNTPAPTKVNSLKKIDRPAFAVLVILYLLQGIPVGLAFGSIPFILKSKLSFAQVGVFSLAAYPYSMKLMWSPIVDAIYSPKIGRRRSWIIPVQIVSGLTLLYLGTMIDQLVENPKTHLTKITTCFFLLVFFCATQDIAVDGWALTSLSPECLSFASTAQTIGINCGYFLSFTIFLALSSPDFANKYLRATPLDHGLFTLGQYLWFWGWIYLLVTALLYFVPEDPPHLAKANQAKLAHEKVKVESAYNRTSPAKWNELKSVYASMYQVLQLPNIQILIVILLTAKFGFQVNEAATNLKLLEKGLSKEDLSITVLIDFPFEMVFGYYAGRWSNGKVPLRPWIIGFAGRLAAAVFAQLLIFFFPKDGKVSTNYFLLIIAQHLLNSFMATIQFVSLSAFFTKIADPAIGGTYMTTLNTISNYGGTWPRLIILYLIDTITISNCKVPESAYAITSEQLKEQCKNAGGIIEIVRDGYYYTNTICVVIGLGILFWVKKKATYLQSLPASAWRVNKD